MGALCTPLRALLYPFACVCSKSTGNKASLPNTALCALRPRRPLLWPRGRMHLCPSAAAPVLFGKKRASWVALQAALILGFSWSHFAVMNQKLPGTHGDVRGVACPLVLPQGLPGHTWAPLPSLGPSRVEL